MRWYQKLFLCMAILLVSIGCGREHATVMPQLPYITPIPTPSPSAREAMVTQPNIPPTPTETRTGALPEGAVVALPPTPIGGLGETPTPAAYTMTLALESQLLDREQSILHKGDPAPDFSYTLSDGTTHQLSQLRGNKVLINFWATWCPPCRMEMPDLQKSFHTHRQEGFMVLAISQDKERERIAPFVSKFQLAFPVIADPEGAIARRYGVRALPMSFFINTDGTIDSWVLGAVSERLIEERLNAMP